MCDVLLLLHITQGEGCIRVDRDRNKEKSVIHLGRDILFVNTLGNIHEKNTSSPDGIKMSFCGGHCERCCLRQLLFFYFKTRGILCGKLQRESHAYYVWRKLSYQGVHWIVGSPDRPLVEGSGSVCSCIRNGTCSLISGAANALGIQCLADGCGCRVVSLPVSSLSAIFIEIKRKLNEQRDKLD